MADVEHVVHARGVADDSDVATFLCCGHGARRLQFLGGTTLAEPPPGSPDRRRRAGPSRTARCPTGRRSTGTRRSRWGRATANEGRGPDRCLAHARPSRPWRAAAGRRAASRRRPERTFTVVKPMTRAISQAFWASPARASATRMPPWISTVLPISTVWWSHSPPGPPLPVRRAGFRRQHRRRNRWPAARRLRYRSAC